MRRKKNSYEFNYDSYGEDKQEEKQVENTESSPVSELSKDDKKNIIVSVILLLVLVLGVGGYFLYQNNLLSGIGLPKSTENEIFDDPTNMDEDPRKSEDEENKNNTTPDKNGNKNTNTNTPNPNTNQTPNPNNTPKTTEKTVPKEDNNSKTNVDVNKENNDSKNQGTVIKEDDKGSKTTVVPKTNPTTANVPKTSPTTAKKNETNTNSSPQTTKVPSTNPGTSPVATTKSGGTSGGSGGSGGQSSGSSSGGSGSTGSGSGSNAQGGGTDPGDDPGNMMTINTHEYPKYADVIKEIKFVRMEESAIKKRYNASSKKNVFDWSRNGKFYGGYVIDNGDDKGNIWSWVENNIAYVASPKTIYLTNKTETVNKIKSGSGIIYFDWHDAWFGVSSDDPYSRYYYAGYYNLEKIDFENVNTSKMVYMGLMFKYARNLKEIVNLNKFDTSNVVNMQSMFEGCTKLKTLDLSSFDTSKVVDMYKMFYLNNSLKTIYASNKWSTKSLKNYGSMFSTASCIEGMCAPQQSYLVGGAGTKCSTMNKTTARIDKAGSPGCLTYKAN